jgi:hypothetical protein
MTRRLARTIGPLLVLALLATAMVAQAAPKVATIEVKGVVCSA